MEHLYINRVEMAPGGVNHEHIAVVSGIQPYLWSMSMEQAVRNHQAGLARFFVQGSLLSPPVEAALVVPLYGRPHLRTHADGVPTNNLLALPGGPNFGTPLNRLAQWPAPSSLFRK